MRQLGDQYVAYNLNSGSTHLLGFVAGQILVQLESSPMDTDSLTSKLAAEWEQNQHPEFSRGVESVLVELHALDLIRVSD